MDKLRGVALAQDGPWPEWCLAPRKVAYAAAVHYNLVSPGGRRADGAVDIAGLQWPGVLAALYAWRRGRGIYRYDAELAAAVVASDLPKDIGTDVLLRLAEWGIYVDPAGALGPDVAGFWAHLEWDATRALAELRFVWDLAEGHFEICPVPLGYPSVAAAMEAAMAHAGAKANEFGITEADLDRGRGGQPGPSDFNYQLIGGAVMLTLYLCTGDADVVDPDRPDAQPRRAMAPCTTETHWEVGYRLGTALRAARSWPAESHGGSHATPAAHLRRAHWHHYWRGPMAGPRYQVCVWQRPIMVGAGETLPTIHDAK